MKTNGKTGTISAAAGFRRHFLTAIALPLFAASMLVIAGCEDEGPVEETVDEVEEAAEETADEVEEAAEETADEAEEAAEEAGDEIE